MVALSLGGREDILENIMHVYLNREDMGSTDF